MDVVDEESEASERNWDGAAHTIYMHVRVEEVRANNRSTRNTTFFNVGKTNFLSKFDERSSRNYPHQQLKNKWDCVAHTI